MSDMQDYSSSLADPTSRKFETFSYLPEMDAARIRKQVYARLKRKARPTDQRERPDSP